MEQLKQTEKITMATLKSFAKRNSTRIHYKVKSSFDGQTDMVEDVSDATWKLSKLIPGNSYYRSGIDGIYTVGSSRDYLKLYEDPIWIGIEVSNCCGCSILAIKKIEDLDDEL
jgi:hypothetical protein